ncbi:Hsp20/alpha crystallin family protein [Tateyamaria sp. Alg231-49]|uniref:Hsp20/alpha crystallin family protein n=1 Tax=Tateyamaria sp. Alg231-49 TaxID=1922219 RepID=UPI000D5624F4|nr:Hsp20/alpha crystallin family protein [Tateyamaria sp. Alg231-49]
MVEKNAEYGRWPSLYDPLFEPLRTLGHRVADWLKPASAASSNDDVYTISMELPGVSESDVDLSVHNGSLVIRGEKKTESEQKGDTWYFSERQYGAFSRSFQLPEDADGGKAQASMKDGVLEVTVPRLVLEDKNKSQKIAISKP